MLERIAKDNFVQVKTGDKWIQKQVYLWNEAHPDNPVIKGKEVVIFLDGNRRNFEINNLEKITRGELLVINRDYGISPNPEITRLIINTVKMKRKRIELARNVDGMTNKNGYIIEDVRDSSRKWYKSHPEYAQEKNKRNIELHRKKMEDPVYAAEFNRKRREKRRQQKAVSRGDSNV